MILSRKMNLVKENEPPRTDNQTLNDEQPNTSKTN